MKCSTGKPPDPAAILLGLSVAATILTLPSGPGITAGMGVVVICLLIIFLARRTGLDPDFQLHARVIDIAGQDTKHALVIGAPRERHRLQTLTGQGWTVVEPPLDLARNMGRPEWELELSYPPRLQLRPRGTSPATSITVDDGAHAALRSMSTVILILMDGLDDLPHTHPALTQASRHRLLFAAVARVRASE